MFDRLMVAGIVLFLIGVLALAIFSYVDRRSDKRACEDRGGTYEKYNCQTDMVPMNCGSGCTMLVPEEDCDYRCMGGSL